MTFLKSGGMYAQETPRQLHRISSCTFSPHPLCSLVLPGSSTGKESVCNARDSGLIPWLGRSPAEGIGYPLWSSWASLVAQTVKNPSVCNVGDLGSIPRLGRIPWRRERLPTSVLWPGESHRSPWGHQEQDMADRLSLSLRY